MKVISEIVDGETFIEIVFTERESKSLANYTFLTKCVRILGKPVNLALYRSIQEDNEEEEL